MKNRESLGCLSIFEIARVLRVVLANRRYEHLSLSIESSR
jgi:hypothetical protein